MSGWYSAVSHLVSFPSLKATEHLGQRPRTPGVIRLPQGKGHLLPRLHKYIFPPRSRNTRDPTSFQEGIPRALNTPRLTLLAALDHGVWVNRLPLCRLTTKELRIDVATVRLPRKAAIQATARCRLVAWTAAILDILVMEDVTIARIRKVYKKTQAVGRPSRKRSPRTIGVKVYQGDRLQLNRRIWQLWQVMPREAEVHQCLPQGNHLFHRRVRREGLDFLMVNWTRRIRNWMKALTRMKKG